MAVETLTHRERLLNTLRCQPTDRLPDYEFGAWRQTLARWQREGLELKAANAESSDEIISHTFATDEAEFGPGLDVKFFLWPPFTQEILEERDGHQIFIDEFGALVEQMHPDRGSSIPRYLRYAIESRSDWERLRDERLDPNHPERIPFEIDSLGRQLATATYPVILPGYPPGWQAPSLYGWIRNWMGVERLSLALYDDPGWVEEMMEHLTFLFLSLLERLAGKVQVDLCWWWEDMCYNRGPLISPQAFAKLMVPRYRRIATFLRHELNCEYNMLDCDGNIHKLVPLWLQAGINVMFPLEALHTDTLQLSQEFGDQVAFRGAFNKVALIEGAAAIDREFEHLRPLLKTGRFIPHTDHRVPPDVSLDNYQYYRRRKCKFIGKECDEGYLL